MDMDLNNAYNLARQANLDETFETLCDKFNHIDRENLTNIYKHVISARQHNVAFLGGWLERKVSDILIANQIQHKTQIHFDKDGIVTESRSRGTHIVDIVVGNVIVGTHISMYAVVSCKVTCRERWKQDDWMTNHKPRKYILATVSKDYPHPALFCESLSRKIITSIPKVKDTRVYKCGFDSLVTELSHM